MAPSILLPQELPLPIIQKQNKISRTTPLSVQQAIAEACERFESHNSESKRRHEEAVRSMPGGNTRTLLHTKPFPICMVGGKDWMVTDVDGHIYTDLVGELTAGLYGHSHPTILSALHKTLSTTGLSLGAVTPLESRYASLLSSRFNLPLVRFTNSGTEANLHALAAARRFTGKRKVLVFSGGYHGAVFSFANGVAENNVDRDDFVVARYNDLEDAKEKLETAKGEFAAVLLEGMQGSGGSFPGTHDFLTGLREAAREASIPFILDEVMTSRLSPSGLSALHSLSPDLTTLGKYLGGGLAFGAFGGRADIMSVYDPRSRNALAHSGTFNNNTLAMAAGHAGLAEVFTPDVCVALNERGDELRGVLQVLARGTKMCVTGLGSMMAVHFYGSGRGPEEVRRVEDEEEDVGLGELFWLECLENGFWMTRRGFVALMLGIPEGEYERFGWFVEGFLERYKGLVGV